MERRRKISNGTAEVMSAEARSARQSCASSSSSFAPIYAQKKKKKKRTTSTRRTKRFDYLHIMISRQRCTPISAGHELQDRAAAARIPLAGTPDTDLFIFFLKPSARTRHPYYKPQHLVARQSAATRESLLETRARRVHGGALRAAAAVQSVRR